MDFKELNPNTHYILDFNTSYIDSKSDIRHIEIIYKGENVSLVKTYHMDNLKVNPFSIEWYRHSSYNFEKVIEELVDFNRDQILDKIMDDSFLKLIDDPPKEEN